MKRILRILILTAILFSSINLSAQLPLTKEGKSPFVEVVKNIRESVVNIRVEFEVEYGQRGSQFPFNDEFFKFFFPDLPKQPRSQKLVSMGSGFIFKQNGREVYIITNNHVVERADKGNIIVTLADKAKYNAEIIGLDSETDLAVIKIKVDKYENITIAPLGNSDEIEIGDWAIAIGNPFGQLGLERTVTVGVISATGRANLYFGTDSPIYQDYIQTDAAINPGNSGGPLLNIDGEVIGVNAAITSTSGGNVGIGFAIPVNLAKKVTNDLLKEGKVVRAYIGILPQEIDSDLRESLNLKEVKGVLVAKVEKDTPAEEAGLKKGDVIINFNGKEVPNVAKFRILVANSNIGKKIPITVIRRNKEKTIYVTLIQRPDELSKADTKKSPKTSNTLGLEVEEVDGSFAKRNNIKEEEGIIITKILPDTPAAESQLKVGDIILEINQHAIESVSDFNSVIKDIKNNIVLFYIKSISGNYQFVTVKIK
ncbi:MAG: Do family serine endopeptidase [Candidatus Cloacimonetes bacterium]|nr:Do family serine endopeptidase [Candidatus Cloacimonadota bacterium]